MFSKPNYTPEDTRTRFHGEASGPPILSVRTRIRAGRLRAGGPGGDPQISRRRGQPWGELRDEQRDEQHNEYERAIPISRSAHAMKFCPLHPQHARGTCWGFGFSPKARKESALGVWLWVLETGNLHFANCLSQYRRRDLRCQGVDAKNE